MTRPAIALLTALTATTALAACGLPNVFDGNPDGESIDGDTVFLYFINGNPGADEMTIKRTSGKLAKDIGFGERAATDGSCPQGDICIPIAVDRNLGTSFTFVFDGEKSEVDLGDELTEMYLHETATVVLTGRSGAMVVRHKQSISEQCGLTVVNGLAVGDESDDFSFAREFNLSPEVAGYEHEFDTAFQTSCGALPTGEPDHAALARAEQLRQIREEPWFFPADCGPKTCFRWALPDASGRGALSSTGAFEAVSSSAEYFECVQQNAITVDTCPDSGLLTWDAVQVDEAQARACAEPVSMKTPLTAPKKLERHFGATACEADFRIRTPELDLVFGPDRDDDVGHHADGALIRSQVDVPQGSEQFWVLLGRPVNPVTWQWNSSETFVDLESFPYRNDQQERVGDY